MILVIGRPFSVERGGLPLHRMGGFRSIDFSELQASLLDELLPEMVLSPLTSVDYDAVDVARRLSEFGYRGPYRAMAEVLPNAQAVRDEVRDVAPGLDFDVLVLRPADPDAP